MNNFRGNLGPDKGKREGREGREGRDSFSFDVSKWTLRISDHAMTTINNKRFDLHLVEKTYADPASVYPSGSHIGQYRVTGNGLCLVGKPEQNGVFSLITIYEDQVLTAPRPDQLNTPEGRRYAERHQLGLGRG